MSRRKCWSYDFTFYLDNTIQTIIKTENEDHDNNNHLKSSTNIEQPLLIVLDDDDVNIDEENELDRTNIINEQNLSKGRYFFSK